MADEDETIRFLADVASLVDELKTHSNSLLELYLQQLDLSLIGVTTKQKNVFRSRYAVIVMSKRLRLRLAWTDM